MPDIELQIPLTEPQKEFLNSDNTNTFFVSGRGGGKSFASFLKILTLPPRSRIYYIAPTYRNIKDISITTLKKIAEKIYKHTRINIIRDERITDTEVELNNRTRIYFRGAENYEKLRGISTEYLFIDEAAAIAEDAWDIVYDLDPVR
jgi:phage terminase large subunit